MTDQELDLLMRRVLLDGIKLESDQKRDNVPAFVPTIGHQKQMKSMLNDPWRWMRKRECPLWQAAARRIAVALLLLSLGFGCVMAASPTARAIVVRWAAEWYENHITYWYFGENIRETMPDFKIATLPEGYAEVASKRIEESNYMSHVYQKEDGDTIYLDYTYMQQGSAVDVITENVDSVPITVNGMEGCLYLANDPDQEYNTLLWINPEYNIQFSLDAPLSPHEILRLAESVCLS